MSLQLLHNANAAHLSRVITIWSMLTSFRIDGVVMHLCPEAQKYNCTRWRLWNLYAIFLTIKNQKQNHSIINKQIPRKPKRTSMSHIGNKEHKINARTTGMWLAMHNNIKQLENKRMQIKRNKWTIGLMLSNIGRTKNGTRNCNHVGLQLHRMHPEFKLLRPSPTVDLNLCCYMTEKCKNCK